MDETLEFAQSELSVQNASKSGETVGDDYLIVLWCSSCSTGAVRLSVGSRGDVLEIVLRVAGESPGRGWGWHRCSNVAHFDAARHLGTF